MVNYILVTDGSIKERGVSDGGYAFRFSLIDETGKKTLLYENGGSAKDTTTPRMEMTAILEGLKYVWSYAHTHKVDKSDNLIIISDSDLCVRILTDYIYRWMKSVKEDGVLINSNNKPVLNQDLIKEAFYIISTLKNMMKVHIFHIKSHLAKKNRDKDMKYFIKRNNCSISIELFNSIVEENEIVDKLAYNYMKMN